MKKLSIQKKNNEILIFISSIILTSCSSYFVSYEYYRFRNDGKMLIENSSEVKSARENIIFKNQDIQITAELEESRLPSFRISTNFKMYRDSVLINNINIFIREDTLREFTKILVNVDSKGLYFDKFNDIPKDYRLNPTETFYFGYANSPTKNEIGLKIFLDYNVGNRVFSDTIIIEGLMRIKTKKHFVGLH